MYWLLLLCRGLTTDFLNIKRRYNTILILLDAGGRRRRGLQQLWSRQENEDLRNEMGEDAEEIEDINSWFEANVAKPDFQKAVAR